MITFNNIQSIWWTVCCCTRNNTYLIFEWGFIGYEVWRSIRFTESHVLHTFPPRYLIDRWMVVSWWFPEPHLSVNNNRGSTKETKGQEDKYAARKHTLLYPFSHHSQHHRHIPVDPLTTPVVAYFHLGAIFRIFHAKVAWSCPIATLVGSFCFTHTLDFLHLDLCTCTPRVYDICFIMLTRPSKGIFQLHTTHGES